MGARPRPRRYLLMVRAGSGLRSGLRDSPSALGPALWVLVAVALGVRLAVVAATQDVPLASDPADYHRHAMSLARGDGYPETKASGGGPSALRPPGYPSFLAGVYTITGPNPTAGRVAQALIGTFIVVLVGLLANRVWNRRTALVCSGLAAVFPPLLVAGASLQVEPSFVVLMLAALLAVLRYRGSERWAWALLAGVLGGLASLTRSNGLVLLLPLALGVWIARPRWSWKALVAPIAVLAAAAITIAPWTVRNAVVMDAFVPLSTQGGYTLGGTYSEEARTDRRLPSAWRLPVRPGEPGSRRLGEVALGDRLTAAATKYAVEHPLYVLATGYRNTLRLLHLRDLDYGRQTLQRPNGVGPGLVDLSIVSFYLVLLFGLVGATTRAARGAPRFLWLTPVLLLLSAVFVQGQARFRVPIDPFIVILAGLGLIGLWDRVRDIGSTRLPLPGRP